jgi:hypothetical protein
MPEGWGNFYNKIKKFLNLKATYGYCLIPVRWIKSNGLWG